MKIAIISKLEHFVIIIKWAQFVLFLDLSNIYGPYLRMETDKYQTSLFYYQSSISGKSKIIQDYITTFMMLYYWLLIWTYQVYMCQFQWFYIFNYIGWQMPIEYISIFGLLKYISRLKG